MRDPFYHIIWQLPNWGIFPREYMVVSITYICFYLKAVAPGSDLTPCSTIDKPLVVYILFSNAF